MKKIIIENVCYMLDKLDCILWKKNKKCKDNNSLKKVLLHKKQDVL